MVFVDANGLGTHKTNRRATFTNSARGATTTRGSPTEAARGWTQLAFSNDKHDNRSTPERKAIGKRTDSLAVSKRREFNNIAHVSIIVFRIKIIVNSRRVRAIIDSGAGGNFASKSAVERYRLAT